jgi:hypothetical protein
MTRGGSGMGEGAKGRHRNATDTSEEGKSNRDDKKTDEKKE